MSAVDEAQITLIQASKYIFRKKNNTWKRRNKKILFGLSINEINEEVREEEAIKNETLFKSYCNEKSINSTVISRL